MSFVTITKAHSKTFGVQSEWKCCFLPCLGRYSSSRHFCYFTPRLCWEVMQFYFMFVMYLREKRFHICNFPPPHFLLSFSPVWMFESTSVPRLKRMLFICVVKKGCCTEGMFVDHIWGKLMSSFTARLRKSIWKPLQNQDDAANLNYRTNV